MNRKFWLSIAVVPFYITWVFIPVAFLDREKRVGKVAAFAVAAGLAAVEISICSFYFAPKHWFHKSVLSVVPGDMTYRQFFNVCQMQVPYLSLLVIIALDIFRYKTWEEELQWVAEGKFLNKFSDDRMCHIIGEQERQIREAITHIDSMVERVKGSGGSQDAIDEVKSEAW